MERAGDQQEIRSGCVLPVSRKLKLFFATFRSKAPPFLRPHGKIIDLPDQAGRKVQVPLIAIKQIAHISTKIENLGPAHYWTLHVIESRIIAGSRRFRERQMQCANQRTQVAAARVGFCRRNGLRQVIENAEITQ